MEAIKFFRFPYQAGDAIQNMHDVYDIKETFDKYYIVDTTEPLSRYEVIYSAVKNAQNIHARKTISMTVRSKRRQGRESNPANSYFGLFLGQVIPVLKSPAALVGQDAAELTDMLQDSFFEGGVEFWMQVLMSKEYEAIQSEKPIWVQFDLTSKFVELYKKHLESGGQRNPLFEHKMMCFGALNL